MAELLWDGKYRDGQRVLPDRAPRALLTGEIADPLEGNTDPPDTGDRWRNRLIHGETRDVLPALLPTFSGRVNLVYLDPPFATGTDRAITIPVPRAGGPSTPPLSLERVAYRDSWESEANSESLGRYLQWFFETITLLRELLAEDGAIIVHCDWHADAPLRLILDEVFGAANFRNAIAWAYRSGGASRRNALARKHDTLLLYARSPRFAIRPQVERQYLRRPFIGSRRDDAGRHYVDTLLRDVLDGEVTLMRDVGASGGRQLVRRNLRPVLNVSRERLGYPTQKPLGLIELLIEIATDPDDLVLDCCCGSGTTPAAAAIAGRRWLAADSSPFALAATRARLLAVPAARPFMVQHVSASEHDAAPLADDTGRTLHVTARISPAPVPAASVTLTVEGLTLPLRDLPAGALPPDATSGCAWIAYWLADWEHSGDVFHIHDWSGRARDGSAPAPVLTHTYTRPGRRTIAVRAIDLLGGVTTATLDVEA